MKKYLNSDELINILVQKNVNINNLQQAKINIENYSYYSIINGYKTIFKDSNNKYKENVSFEEIFALYQFDKNLKVLFLKYLLDFELIVKSKIANLFSEKYGVKNYLNSQNFDSNPQKKLLIKNLIKVINTEISKNRKKHEAISHYLNKYGFVPLFVVIKVMTFGLISKFYGLMKQGERQQISKQFCMSDNLFKQLLLTLSSIRNICAHSERLFCYRSKFTINFSQIEPQYKATDNLTNLYMIIRGMEFLLGDKKYSAFQKKLNKEFRGLKKSLSSINIKDVKRVMGYKV